MELKNFDQIVERAKKAQRKNRVVIAGADSENIPTELSVPGIRHIAFSVDPSEFEALSEKVSNSGAEILKPAVMNEKGVGTMFFRDIEGNILHLISRKAPLV